MNIKRVAKILLKRDIFIKEQIHLTKHYYGSPYGGWCICPNKLTNNSIVYSFGLGKDISFDLSLIEKYDLNVFGFDPTPISVQWVQTQTNLDNFHLCEFGIASFDGDQKLFYPQNKNNVSFSVYSPTGSGSDYITCKVYKLSTILKKLGHNKIDILKLDIEGSEYDVIDNILNEGIPISQLLVEFHHRFKGISTVKTKETIQKLNKYGYKIFNVSTTGEEYSFIKV